MRLPAYMPLIAFIFLVRAALFMVTPFLFAIVGVGRGDNVVLAGVVVGVIPLTSSVVGILGGHFSDRFMPRTIMCVATAVSASVFLGFAFSTSAAAYLIDAIALGAAQGLFEPASLGLLIDSTTSQNRDPAFGHRYLAINVAAVVGPLIGGLFAIQHTSGAFLCTSSVLMVTAVVMRLVLTNQCRSRVSRTSSVWDGVQSMLDCLRQDQLLKICFVACVLMMIVYGQLTSTLSSFVISNFEHGAHRVGILMSLNAALVVCLQIPITYICRSMGRRNVVAVGGMCFALAPLAPVFLTSCFQSFVVLVVILTFGEMLLFPLSGSLFSDLSSERTRSTYMGVFNATTLGLAVAPILGSTVMRTFGISNLCVFLGATGGLMGLAFATVIRSERCCRAQISECPRT